jgi:hypothetical protein
MEQRMKFYEQNYYGNEMFSAYELIKHSEYVREESVEESNISAVWAGFQNHILSETGVEFGKETLITVKKFDEYLADVIDNGVDSDIIRRNDDDLELHTAYEWNDILNTGVTNPEWVEFSKFFLNKFGIKIGQKTRISEKAFNKGLDALAEYEY